MGADGSTVRPSRRADAQRNIDRILDAATTLFAKSATVSMSEVAREAGVGRVTLYGHFASREELLTAVVDRSLSDATAAMDEVVDDGRPADEILRSLVGASWSTLDRYRRIRVHALAMHSNEWLRDRHDPVLERVEALFVRGREEGTFRTDVPVTWMVTTLYTLIHAADDEADNGRLDRADAPALVMQTVLGAFAP
ncbi:TetR/AcrR family transcriptional regulator [Solicola gregarius]|uniref:TetR/AcrR family transcriptional regulator n=1 Tax=Solicola gregarius TaxID=2908642 RepID=A0AA46TK43_9ACTN|nr:TetR/AcrR family transcriptional regulator [Solicola gregarius]UYM06781.1 TetR/AcrR family transcriptional regulator [Solicola gregarius]